MRGPRLGPLPSIWLVLIAFAYHSVTCLDVEDLGEGCSPGLDTPGVTLPHGDIVLNVGSPLNIYCKLNLKHNMTFGRNASHLRFFEDAKQIDEKYITIINETTIHLHISETKASSKMYYCKLMPVNDIFGSIPTGVCLNSVIVGSKPSKVENFRCFSYNWQNLNCSWTPPHNYIPTKYTVRYKLPGRAGGRKQYDCPTLPQPSKNYCYWDETTTPLYRQPYENYYFFVSGENVLGNYTSEMIPFNHWAHVIPAPPELFRTINETSESVLLEWHTPFPMQTFPAGIKHRIIYQDEIDQKWHYANTSVLDNKKITKDYTYNLTNLPYANTLYDVKVYIMSGKAVGEDRWSIPANITFRTLEKIPTRPPLTNIGSFELAGGGTKTRDVYIYWQRIFKWEQNGKDFEYAIQAYENGLPRHLSPVEMTHSYAKFKAISFNTYKFIIRSVNRIGSSDHSASVIVPNSAQSPSEPQAFTKIAFGNRTYELSWKPPDKDKDIVDYTIFWCDNKNDRPFQCSGFLNWTHVDKSLTIINITVPQDKIYQFAISANTHNSSSGMIWASCTVLHNKVGKMKSVWIMKPSATYIEVGWKLECSDRIGSVIGYKIYYCPIKSPTVTDCRDDEPLLNTIVEGDPSTIRGNMTNLKPYTTYRVSVSVLTKTDEGQQSEPQFSTTLEDAPTPPLNVSVKEVTNISAVVTWNPPKTLNGVLLYYHVHFNKTQILVEQMNNTVKLTGLVSFSDYNLTVTACTVKCSNHSKEVSFKTLVGKPGQIERPTVHFLNSSQVLVYWKAPSQPGGEIDHYEIMVTQYHENSESNFSRYSYTSQGNKSQIPIPDCNEGSRKIYHFKIRGINKFRNVTYNGPWSLEGEGSCFLRGLTQAQITVIWVTSTVVFTIVIGCMIFFINKVCNRIKKMQGVEVKLPPGLDPKGEKEKDQDYHLHVHTWSSEGPREHHLSKTLLNNSADEELLLQNKEDRHGRNPSGDSSGCSSGHESVSSSITNGTQISSDSGTEADQLAASPDGVFPDSSGWDCSSLRQHCGSVPNDPGWEQYVPMAGSSCATRSTPNLTDLDSCPPASGNYSCLSTAPAWSSTSYISNEGFTGAPAPRSGYCTVGNDTVYPQSHVKGYVSLAHVLDADAPPNLLHQSSSPIWDDSQDSPPALPVTYVMAGEHRVTEPSENGPVDPYCRFGLRSSPSPGITKKSGYVTLSDTQAFTRPIPAVVPSTFQPNGYVSHRHFDKKVKTSPIEPEPTQYTKVFPTTTNENPLKTPPASV